MIDALFNSTAVPLLEQVVRFSEQRQKLLAGNVANIDTPGYKPRDLSVEKFKQSLRDAIAAGESQPGVSASLSADGSGSKGVDQFFPEELFSPNVATAQNITFQDGNNRSVERAMMEMKKNAGMQRFAIEVITSQLNMLQSVISERP